MKSGEVIQRTFTASATNSDWSLHCTDQWPLFCLKQSSYNKCIGAEGVKRTLATSNRQYSMIHQAMAAPLCIVNLIHHS